MKENVKKDLYIYVERISAFSFLFCWKWMSSILWSNRFE